MLSHEVGSPSRATLSNTGLQPPPPHIRPYPRASDRAHICLLHARARRLPDIVLGPYHIPRQVPPLRLHCHGLPHGWATGRGRERVRRSCRAPLVVGCLGDGPAGGLGERATILALAHGRGRGQRAAAEPWRWCLRRSPEERGACEAGWP